jgi:hypothetical protein
LPKKVTVRAARDVDVGQHAQRVAAREEADHLDEAAAGGGEDRRVGIGHGGGVVFVEAGVAHRPVERAERHAAPGERRARHEVVAVMPGDEEDRPARGERGIERLGARAGQGRVLDAGGEFRARIHLDQGAARVVGDGADDAADLGLGQVGADMGEVVADAAVPAGERRHERAAIQPVAARASGRAGRGAPREGADHRVDGHVLPAVARLGHASAPAAPLGPGGT